MSRRAQVRCPIHPELVVVGVDVAKRSFVARAHAADGRCWKLLRFGCDAAGFRRLLEYGEESAKRFGCQGFVVAMEPTGHYGHPLACWLKACGVAVYAVQPLHTSRMSELFDGTRRKTDDKDATVIAELCRQGLAAPWRLLGEVFEQLRVFTRRRQQLVVERSQVVNRMQRVVDVVFPELRELFVKPQSRTMRWVLATAPTPAAVLALGPEALTAGLRAASRGQLGPERAAAMLAAAESSVGMTLGLPAHLFALRQHLSELESVLDRLSGVEAEMRRSLAEVPYAARLLSIPCFGPVTVAVLLGELGDLSGFRSVQQVIKLAGLDLVEASSGQKVGRRRISRRGRVYVRQLLYMAALKAGSSFLSEPRRRMVEERGKPPKTAAVANMRRLLRIAFAVVRDGVDFDYSPEQPRQEVPMAA